MEKYGNDSIFILHPGSSKDELENAYSVLSTAMTFQIADELLQIIIKYLQTPLTIDRLLEYMNPKFGNWSLDGRKITEKECMIMAVILKTNNRLAVLRMGKNNIGDGGASALAKVLETNRTLGTLGLGNNQIGDSGAEAIGNALKVNSTLSTVYLWKNKIGDRGATAIGNALETNTNVITLLLAYNNISTEGILILDNVKNERKIMTNYGGSWPSQNL